ncbi:MAG: CRTAC1 family protein [Planctomycetaceae bacterium]|nr:CRTAC1 family protein [Planctomycetaceae bacterium]
MSRWKNSDFLYASSLYGLLAFCFFGCRPNPVEVVEDPPSPTASVRLFVDVSDEVGLHFEHQVGDFSQYEMPAIMGGGGACVDYDLDGVTDYYLPNGMRQLPKAGEDISISDALFRGRVGAPLQDVTPHPNILLEEFGMGAWWGDFDVDGFPDVYLSNVGTNRLFRNLGDGTFEEVPLPPTSAAWSTACSWIDINHDGLLDLFVANYVDYIPGQYCEGADGKREFCGPSAYPGMVDRLLVNTGGESDEGLSFTDETVHLGFGDMVGKGLGTITRDFNRDGLVDIYVANDMEANRLWIQQRDGTFRDEALLLGVAHNFLGETEASMGVVAHDWNDDSIPDLLVAHLAGETNTFYLSEADSGVWSDATAASQMGPYSLPNTGFGVALFDVELDGDLDFLIANGSVKRLDGRPVVGNPRDAYAQQSSLFLKEGSSLTFSDESSNGGDFTTSPMVGRALATTDFDFDGDLDVVVVDCGKNARLMRNEAKHAGNWYSVRLVDPTGSRQGTGANVALVDDGGKQFVRDMNPYQGYLSQNEGRIHFGLGSEFKPREMSVTWADGTQESFVVDTVNTRVVVVRGQGIRSESAIGGHQ